MIPTLITNQPPADSQYQRRKPNLIPSKICGIKRDRSSTFAQSVDPILNPSGRLSSTIQDSLHSNPGLSKSPLLHKPHQFSVSSFAGILSSIKARGRATSSASEQTANTYNIQRKCPNCRCPTSENILSPFLSPNSKLKNKPKYFYEGFELI